MAIESVLSIQLGSKAVGVDAVGHAGGIFFTWDPFLLSEKAYNFFGGIILHGHLRGLSEPIFLINIYAPCHNRAVFW